ncbi:MAG: hypothetical protein R3F14_26080 [Polyangiaceae bacterium]
MHLSHLRRRFLIAMGVPALGTTWAACASPPPPDDPTDPRLGQTTTLQIAGDPDTTAGDTQSGGGAQVATGARPCGPDEILETICGSVAAPGSTESAATTAPTSPHTAPPRSSSPDSPPSPTTPPSRAGPTAKKAQLATTPP